MPNILVFGSAHLDVYAQPEKGTTAFADKPGAVRYFIGGSGFNIAKNLALNNRPVSLFTHLPAYSPFSSAVYAELKAADVDARDVILDESLAESGFVAVLDENSFRQAVSCMDIESARLDMARAETAITASELVVFDCNLSAEQINTLTQACWKLGKKVVVSAVSTAKAPRYLSVNVEKGEPFFLVSLKRDEAVGLFGQDLGPDPEIWNCKDALAKFKTHHLIVSAGAKGYITIDARGLQKFSAPEINRREGGSDIGAGDALIAGHCACIRPGKQLDWDEAENVSKQMIREVFKYYAATPPISKRADAKNPLPIDKELLQKKEPGLSRNPTVVVAIVAAMATVVAAFVTAFFKKG